MTTETQDSIQHAEAPPPPPSPSPGAMIREARERAHLSLEDMAAHTKLARPTLEALERDDYQSLLEPVYVRGYYRKCAKVLEIDEERLIAAYNARVVPKALEAPSKLRLASGTELGSSSRLPVSMAVLAAIVAVVVCAFIWFARDDQETYPLPVVGEPSLPGAAAEATPLPAVPLENVIVEPTAPAADAQPVPTAAPRAQSVPAEEPAVAPGTLRLRFVETSWARIDDASGKPLLNPTLGAGAERTLTGQAPLSIFLGNAPGVIVEFEGRVIDIKPFVRGNNTARFTLPLE
jgi:cytoskeleton protein RodZ